MPFNVVQFEPESLAGNHVIKEQNVIANGQYEPDITK